MPTGSKLRVSKGAEPGVQFPPFPLSKRNRTECPSATEIRSADPYPTSATEEAA